METMSGAMREYVDVLLTLYLPENAPREDAILDELDVLWYAMSASDRNAMSTWVEANRPKIFHENS